MVEFRRDSGVRVAGWMVRRNSCDGADQSERRTNKRTKVGQGTRLRDLHPKLCGQRRWTIQESPAGSLNTKEASADLGVFGLRRWWSARRNR